MPAWITWLLCVLVPMPGPRLALEHADAVAAPGDRPRGCKADHAGADDRGIDPGRIHSVVWKWYDTEFAGACERVGIEANDGPRPRDWRGGPAGRGHRRGVRRWPGDRAHARDARHHRPGRRARRGRGGGTGVIDQLRRVQRRRRRGGSRRRGAGGQRVCRAKPGARRRGLRRDVRALRHRLRVRRRRRPSRTAKSARRRRAASTG